MAVAVLILVILLVLGFFAVFSKDLFTSAISLGFMSVALAGLFFYLGLSYAGAFEISAGAGLTTVMFVSMLTLVAGIRSGKAARTNDRPGWALWVGTAITLALIIALGFSLGESRPLFIAGGRGADVGYALWKLRAPDIVALGLLVFSGALGISALFHRERGNQHG